MSGHYAIIEIKYCVVHDNFKFAKLAEIWKLTVFVLFKFVMTTQRHVQNYYRHSVNIQS